MKEESFTTATAPLTADQLAALEEKANALRKHVIRMTAEAGSGHPGGSLSSAEIVTLLYFHLMRLRPEEPDWPGRDRFVLAKGHVAPVLYAALAERGFFGVDELLTLRKLGSRLQGHPDVKVLPGVEASTGSLGQGLSIGCGMALAARLDQLPYRVYVLLGDGELQSGQVWEAAMAAAHYGLDNLIVFVDYNGLQSDGPVGEVLCPEPLEDKWRGFGWHVQRVDGHDLCSLNEAIGRALLSRGKPSVLVCDTVKGKGVSFMENQVKWHGVAPDPDQARLALEELERGRGDD